MYAATKAALRAYALTVAADLSIKNVYVNVCWPSAMSQMNKTARHSPKDIAEFVAALFLTHKAGCLFSVTGKIIALVGDREFHYIDNLAL